MEEEREVVELERKEKEGGDDIWVGIIRGRGAWRQYV